MAEDLDLEPKFWANGLKVMVAIGNVAAAKKKRKRSFECAHARPFLPAESVIVPFH